MGINTYQQLLSIIFKIDICFSSSGGTKKNQRFVPGWGGGGLPHPLVGSGVKRLAGGVSLAANVWCCRGASSLAGLVDLLVLLVAGGHLGKRGLGLLVGYLGSCRGEVPVTLGGEHSHSWMVGRKHLRGSSLLGSRQGKPTESSREIPTAPKAKRSSFFADSLQSIRCKQIFQPPKGCY